MTDTGNPGPIAEGDKPREEVELRLKALGPGLFRLEAVLEGSTYHDATLSLEDEKAIADFATAAAAIAQNQLDREIDPDGLIRRLRLEVSGLAASGALSAAQVDAEDGAAGVLRAPDDPHRLARIFLVGRHHHPDRPSLVHRCGQFLAWDGRRYAEDRDVASRLTAAIGLEFARMNKEEGVAPEGGAASSRTAAARKVGCRLVADVKQALASLVHVPSTLDDPAWLAGSDKSYPAREVVPFANALVSLPRYARGETCWVDPTPGYFSTRCLPHEFEPDAPPPSTWLGFLSELWGEDVESMRTLQEWFGYCLTPDTSLQKILLLIGPTRSGKGTIARVLTALIGVEGVAAPSLSTLASQFGAASLVDKLVAIVPDARLSGRADQGMIVERLLSISGEDRIEVDRKHRDPWTGTLPTRLMLLSNELPRLRDASLALANRLVVLGLNESFLGREDPRLTGRILGELPGIFNWAVEGWRELQLRGHFEPPKSSRGLVEDIREIASPVAQFVADCCESRPGAAVPVDRLYHQYRAWCDGQGKVSILEKAVFGRDLKAVLPRITNVQRSTGGLRTRYYEGIGLREADAP